MKKAIYLHLTLLSIILLSLTSCISNPNINDLSTEGRQQLSSMKVFRDIKLPKESYNIIKSIEGISCKRNAYDSKVVTEDEAITGMKIKSAQLNADAITNIVCQHNTGTDWSNNCWGSIVCIGDAIEITNTNLLPQP